MMYKEELKMLFSEKFQFDMKEKLHQLCLRENYFSCGSSCQLDRMLSMSVMPQYTYRDIAIMIFTCTEIPEEMDGSMLFSDIQNQVESLWVDILECEKAVLFDEGHLCY